MIMTNATAKTPASVPTGAACPIAIVGATLIDGTGCAPVKDAVVVISEGRIAAIGGPTTEVPQEATRIDGTGQYLIPGLMDASVDLLLDVSPLQLIRHQGRWEVLIIEAAQRALGAGFTCLFNTWGPLEELLAARGAIEAGAALGPRLKVCGNIIGMGGPYSADIFKDTNVPGMEAWKSSINAHWEAGTGSEITELAPAELIARLNEKVLSRGVDFLAVLTDNVPPAAGLRFSPRQIRAIVEAGHAASVPVWAMAGNTEALHVALPLVDGLYQINSTNARGIAEESIKALCQQQYMPWTAAVYSASRVAERAARSQEHPELKDFAVADRNLVALLNALPSGLVFSTESGLAGEDFLASALWSKYFSVEAGERLTGRAQQGVLQGLAEKGLSGMDILTSLTSSVARAYRLEKDLGTLQRGKLADLVLLAQDPLTSVESYGKIVSVMKGGVFVDRAPGTSRSST